MAEDFDVDDYIKAFQQASMEEEFTMGSNDQGDYTSTEGETPQVFFNLSGDGMKKSLDI